VTVDVDLDYLRLVYGDVIDLLRSAGFGAELVLARGGWPALEVLHPHAGVLLLSDFFDPLPAARLEQVGWTLSSIDRQVLGSVESATAASALQLLRSLEASTAGRHQLVA
jgi:hypothetical protein